MSETNSPGAIARSTFSSAVVRPPAASKVLLPPATSTTRAPACSVMRSASCGGARPAPEHDELRDPHRGEERQAQQCRGEHRRPQLLGASDVLLVEVQD